MVSLLLLTGCSNPEQTEHEKTLAAAPALLDDAVSDSTLIAGFDISSASVDLYSGEPPRSLQLSPVEREGSEVSAHPLWVRGSDFPLSDSVALAVDNINDCDFGRSRVRALAEGVVVTESQCEKDGQTQWSAWLGSQQLSEIANPMSGDAVLAVWKDSVAAKLSDRVAEISLDTHGDTASVRFPGPAESRLYEWKRGLREPRTEVSSAERSVSVSAPPSVPMDRVAEGVDAALESLSADARSSATRLSVSAQSDAWQIVIQDAEYNTLATVKVG